MASIPYSMLPLSIVYYWAPDLASNAESLSSSLISVTVALRRVAATVDIFLILQAIKIAFSLVSKLSQAPRSTDTDL